MKRQNLLLLAIPFFISACQQTDKKDFSAFPQDLMYQGKPIHPSIMIATQFGDSSRLEPKSVVYNDNFDDAFLSTVHEELTYHKATVSYTRTYSYAEYSACEHDMHDSYEYVGSYKGKHIILGENYDTSGTGRFAFLSLVRREGEALINAGEIAAGDRGHGGCIRIISCNKNIVHFSQAATIDMILNAFSDTPFTLYFPPMTSGLSLIREVDLDAPMQENDLPTRIVGLQLHNDVYDFDECPDFWEKENPRATLEQVENRFYKVADAYAKEGKKELLLKDAQLFAQQAFKNIQKILA